MRDPTFSYSESADGVFKLFGSADVVLNALAGLLECFDDEGIFRQPFDLSDRIADGRTALERALPEEVWKLYEKDRRPSDG